MSNIPSNSGSNPALRWNVLRSLRTDRSCKSNEVHVLLLLSLAALSTSSPLALFSSPNLFRCDAPLLSYKRWKDLRWCLVCCRDSKVWIRFRLGFALALPWGNLLLLLFHTYLAGGLGGPVMCCTVQMH